MTKEIPELAILNCGAAHDELCVRNGKSPNKSLPFCALNGVCSHGNEILEGVIQEAGNSGALEWHIARQMLELLRETHITLVSCIDQKSQNRRKLREGTLSESDEADLYTALGDDPSLWDANLKTLQIERAQPIVRVMRKLEELGLLHIKEDAQDINMRKFVKQSQKAVA